MARGRRNSKEACTAAAAVLIRHGGGTARRWHRAWTRRSNRRMGRHVAQGRGEKTRFESTITTPDEVTGTFCGVRIGDGSVLFYDFDKVKSKVKVGSVELKRGKHTHWVRATDKGVDLGYRRKNKKRHRMALEQGAMQCIGRITPAMAPLDAHDEQDDSTGMVGTWSAYDKRGKATEVRITEHSGKGASGTVCFVRKDDAVAFFDFGPEGRIEADSEGERVTVERKPFKAKMTHVMEMTDDGHLRYSEKVGTKPPRLTLELSRGAGRGRMHPKDSSAADVR